MGIIIFYITLIMGVGVWVVRMFVKHIDQYVVASHFLFVKTHPLLYLVRTCFCLSNTSLPYSYLCYACLCVCVYVFIIFVCVHARVWDVCVCLCIKIPFYHITCPGANACLLSANVLLPRLHVYLLRRSFHIHLCLSASHFADACMLFLKG